MANYEPVVFENSRGEEISNDPVWQARRTLDQAGLASTPGNTLERTARPDDDDYVLTGYEDVKGQELVDLAKSRDIDYKGKKAGEVRALLAAQDADTSGDAKGTAGEGDDTKAE